MKMLKAISVSILLFIGYLCDAQDENRTQSLSHANEVGRVNILTSLESLLKANGSHSLLESDLVPERSLPTLVVAGVSIALVLLCVLIVAVFWYAWKKSQEGSMELNPIPYGEAGVSLRSLSVPENQQEWPLERAVQ